MFTVKKHPSRILITGFGSMGRKHLDSLKNLFPQSEIAVMSLTFNELETKDGSKIFHSAENAKQFLPDAVIIASPATRHAADVINFASSTNRILIEKPLAASLLDAEEIRDAVNKTGARVVLGYNLRYFRPLARFRELLIEGRYGRIHRLECHVGQHLSEWRNATNPSRSVSSRKELGGGVFRELSHEIDYCLWICGEPKQVKARSSRHLEYGDVEDCADLWLEFEGNLHASIHVDMIDRWKRRAARAICEGGTLELDFPTGVLRFNGKVIDLGSVEALTETYVREMEDLFGDGRNSPAASCEDGVAVLRVIELAEQDARAAAL